MNEITMNYASFILTITIRLTVRTQALKIIILVSEVNEMVTTLRNIKHKWKLFCMDTILVFSYELFRATRIKLNWNNAVEQPCITYKIHLNITVAKSIIDKLPQLFYKVINFIGILLSYLSKINVISINKNCSIASFGVRYINIYAIMLSIMFYHSLNMSNDTNVQMIISFDMLLIHNNKP